MHPNVETFIGCDSSYRAASIVLYGAPPPPPPAAPGARRRPAAGREGYGLGGYTPYQNADLTDFDVFDSGDLGCFWLQRAGTGRYRGRAEKLRTASSRCCWVASIWSRWVRCVLR